MKCKLPIKKSKEDIEFYKKYGPRFGDILLALYYGISNKSLNNEIAIVTQFEEFCRKEFEGEFHVRFPFSNVKNYIEERFGNSVCISSDDCLAHGKEFKGKVISVDFGVALTQENDRTLIFDAAFSIDLNKRERAWVYTPQEALVKVVEEFNATKGQKTTNTISAVIEQYARDKGLQVAVSMTGHGIGQTLHEYPYIPNAVADSVVPATLFDGLVLCIEPIFVLPEKDDSSLIAKTYLDSDGWSVRTISGQPGSHFESMFVVEKGKLVDVVGITKWFC